MNQKEKQIGKVPSRGGRLVETAKDIAEEIAWAAKCVPGMIAEEIKSRKKAKIQEIVDKRWGY